MKDFILPLDPSAFNISKSELTKDERKTVDVLWNFSSGDQNP